MLLVNKEQRKRECHRLQNNDDDEFSTSRSISGRKDSFREID